MSSRNTWLTANMKWNRDDSIRMIMKTPYSLIEMKEINFMFQQLLLEIVQRNHWMANMDELPGFVLQNFFKRIIDSHKTTNVILSMTVIWLEISMFVHCRSEEAYIWSWNKFQHRICIPYQLKCKLGWCDSNIGNVARCDTLLLQILHATEQRLWTWSKTVWNDKHWFHNCSLPKKYE